MKVQVKNYTFDKAAKTVAFVDYTSIDLDSILLITNVTSNVIIYNFANPLLGGTALTNVLTLTYDTSSMSNSDQLLIFYEDPTTEAATDESIILLRRVVKLLESNAVVDSRNVQKVVIDGITNGMGSLLGVAVGMGGGNWPTVGAPTNSVGAGYSWQPVWTGPVDQRFQIMDAARLVYNNSIRSHLVFS